MLPPGDVAQPIFLSLENREVGQVNLSAQLFDFAIGAEVQRPGLIILTEGTRAAFQTISVPRSPNDEHRDESARGGSMRISARRRAEWLLSDHSFANTTRQVRVSRGRLEVVELGRGEPIVLVPGLAGGWKLLGAPGQEAGQDEPSLPLWVCDESDPLSSRAAPASRRPRSGPLGVDRRARAGAAGRSSGSRSAGRWPSSSPSTSPIASAASSSPAPRHDFARPRPRESLGGSSSVTLSRATTRSSTSFSISSTAASRRLDRCPGSSSSGAGDGSGRDGTPPGHARGLRRRQIDFGG